MDPGLSARHLRLISVAALTVVSICPAQQPKPQPAAPAAQLKFEVALVRRVKPGCTWSWSPPDSPSFTARCVSMRILISLAYGVDSNRVEGGPGWLDEELYDVVARPPEGSHPDKEARAEMLRQLLGERVGLVAHKATRDEPGYALVVAKGGPRLKPTTAPPTQANILPDQIYAPVISIESLAHLLGYWLKQPTIDATGIQGNYSVSLHFAARDSTDQELPSIFTAVQETLGLKLESRKVPIEVVVVDHIDKEPVEN